MPAAHDAALPATAPRRVVLVTGLSGGGKASMLRILEDLGYEAVDNPPLRLMEDLVVRGERPMAVGVDTRSQGFDPCEILALLARLRRNAALRPELVFILADEGVLLRRFIETRRRHPLAPTSRVADGIAAETALTAPLREAADMLLDTTDLKLPMLRGIVEARFGGAATEAAGMSVSLISFAYPAGLPREAELVFDARFLRNPHYVPTLRDGTGLDADVSAYVEADPDFWAFMDKITDLLSLLLPRFVQEGKKYASVAVGCTGGRHRSVRIIEILAERLRRIGAPGGQGPKEAAWRVGVTHRELLRAVPTEGSTRRGAATSADLFETSRRTGGAAIFPGAGGLTDIP